MSLLDDLPTGVISQIVQQLNPRLYIDFISYLPAEICLKILEHLDPVSLITVARSCRAWYDLALDRKLWEQLYYMEGWQAITSEIQAWEAKVNENLNSSSGPQQQHSTSSEDGHVSKKRAISMSPRLERDHDYMMIDADRPLKQEPLQVETSESSLFGGPSTAGSLMRSSMTPGMGDLNMDGSGTSWTSKIDKRLGALDKGKGKAVHLPSSPTECVKTHSLPEMFPTENPGSIPKSTLWMWDSTSSRYKINWKYLYSMRRRLEFNWEEGNFKNFQFPHPDHPEEGHTECIYSIQFNSEYLVSGSRDDTIRIWSMQTRRLVLPPLTGHRGSVLCLQFDSDPDEDLIVSGSSDSDVILWRFSTGQIIQRLTRAHRESVLNVKFDKRILVTCSKDKTIKIFNRRELKPGDLGYGEVLVAPVPVHLKAYGYDPLDQLPVKPPYTMIGSLEGHSAAVNAVQICGREVVSASGDRNVKIWDWPNQSCLRTFVGHNKGIACVQYDGKRIVSGSSDNEVKVFDRPSGVELASLHSHSNLVRTVQAGFADLPYSAEEDAAEAARVDAEYYKAVEQGTILMQSQDRRHPHRQGNHGSRRPEDIQAVGAKLPPGGGGGQYARIVSGSYDATIIIWRRDKDGTWKARHHLKQEDAALASGRRQLPDTQLHVPPPSVAPDSITPSPAAMGASTNGASVPAASSSATQAIPPIAPAQAVPTEESSVTAINPSTHASISNLIDIAVPQGVHVLQQALASYPAMLSMQGHLQAAIDREQNPFLRSQLRQAVSTALVRNQIAQARARQQLGIQGLLNGPSIAGPSSSSSSGQQQAPAAAGSSSSAAAAAADPAVTHHATPSIPHPVVPIGTSGTASAGGSQEATAAASAAVVDTTGQITPMPHTVQPAPATITGAPPPTVLPPAAGAPRAVHHPHLADAGTSPRVFKLQFDARRIICCSQTGVIVGWDFCNGDEELEECARFFATVE